MEAVPKEQNIVFEKLKCPKVWEKYKYSKDNRCAVDIRCSTIIQNRIDDKNVTSDSRIPSAKAIQVYADHGHCHVHPGYSDDHWGNEKIKDKFCFSLLCIGWLFWLMKFFLTSYKMPVVMLLRLVDIFK